MMLPVPSGPEIGALLALRMVIKRQQALERPRSRSSCRCQFLLC